MTIEAAADPAVVLGELEQLGDEWRTNEARRDDLIARRRRLILRAARECNPPLPGTAIARALGVSQPFVSRLLEAAGKPGGTADGT